MGERIRERETKEYENLRQCGRGTRKERGRERESGWRLWIADVALWGFGRGRARLNPSLAGWHRGEEEVSAPQHTAHKTLRVVRVRSEIIGPQIFPLKKRSQSHVWVEHVQEYTQTSRVF